MADGCLYGHFFIQSTREQVLHLYETYFVPAPVPLPMTEQLWEHYMRVDMKRLYQLLRTDVPTFYLGEFRTMGPLFGMDLSGPILYRQDHNGIMTPLRVRASIGAMWLDDSENASELLFQAFMQGHEAPTGAYVDAWWQSPRLSLDIILPGDYYELFFMKDFGTHYGECLALYATCRRLSCSPRGAGRYVKAELYQVPDRDPALWFQHRGFRIVGHPIMHGWYSSADWRARL